MKLPQIGCYSERVFFFCSVIAYIQLKSLSPLQGTPERKWSIMHWKSRGIWGITTRNSTKPMELLTNCFYLYFTMIFTNQITSLTKTICIYEHKHSVCIYRENPTRNIKNKKKQKQCDDVEVFVDDITHEITEKFKSGCSYSDVSISLTEWPTDLQTKILCQ